MRASRIVGFLITLAMIAPVSVQAISLEDLQSQIGSLLQQITTLQSQIAQLSSTSTAAVSGSSAPAASDALPTCPAFSRNLSRGSRGIDVSNLQLFLASQASAGYRSGVTGFFGPATEASLQAWQKANGIIAAGDAQTTGFGAFGPRTRAAILAACTNISPVVASPVPSTVPVTQVACPAMDIPTTCSGALLARGVDSNGCSLGYSCRAATNGTNPPIIDKLDGPAWIGTGATSTWRISASVPNLPNSNLTYSVRWGDEAANSNVVLAFGTTSSMFSHVYAQAGTYYPVFTATTESASSSISASISVSTSTLIISTTH